MIKNINIQNFRGIKSLFIDDFKRINLFLGKNNCGKTSVLEALFLIIGVTNPILSRNIHLFRNLLLTQTDDFRFMFFQLDFNSEIKIEAEIRPNQTRTLIIKPQVSLSLSENGSQDLTEKISNVLSTSITPSENIDKLILNSVIVRKGNRKPKRFQAEISIDGNKQETKIPKNYKETLNGFFINSDTIYDGLNQRIENLLVRKQKEKLLEPLQFIEPQICDISLGANGLIYLDLGYQRLMPVNLLGDGFRRMLSILAKILDTKNGIVFVDEIENGLHFSSLQVFLKYLIKMAELQNVQLFMTTHSKETLQALNKLLNSAELDKYKSEIKSYTIRKNKEDKTISYPYDFEKFEYSIEQDIEMR